METGEIEIQAKSIKVLNFCQEKLPINLNVNVSILQKQHDLFIYEDLHAALRINIPKMFFHMHIKQI